MDSPKERSIVWQQYLNWATVWVRRIVIGATILATLGTLRSCSVLPPDPVLFATEEEYNLLARMLYSEQAGQGPRIMRAAAWVAINRVLDENFPKTNSLADALIPGQFFVRSQEDIDSRIEVAPLEAAAWEQAQRIAREVAYEYRAYGMADDLLLGKALFFANVVGGDEAKRMYEELLKGAGVERYGILEGSTSWFFYNATASVPVPDDIRPKY